MKGASKPTFTPRRFGKYLLLDRIGRGGMAEVFRAKTFGAAGFVKESAIKKILSSLLDDDQFVRMFVDEAKLTAYLTHPNIVQVLDLGEIDGHLFIAMEYVAGKDLLDVLARSARRGIRIPVELALHICVEMLRGLDFAHKAHDADNEPMNIVHRDVSPSNILISYDGQVKVGDFGIAKSQKQSSHTEVGTQKGKTGYMSPEQVTGAQIDHRSDLFAAAVILFEMITMTRLFKAKNDLEVMLKIRDSDIESDLERAEKISGGLVPIIRKGLAKSPDDRFQSGAEFIEALRDYMQDRKVKTSSAALSAYVAELFTDKIQAERERRKGDPSHDTGFQTIAKANEELFRYRDADGVIHGPMRASMMEELLGSGRPSDAERVSVGGAEWKEAEEVAEFADVQRPEPGNLDQSGDSGMVLRAQHGADWEDLSLAGVNPRAGRRRARRDPSEDSGAVGGLRRDPKAVATREVVAAAEPVTLREDSTSSEYERTATPKGRVTSAHDLEAVRSGSSPVADLHGRLADSGASPKDFADRSGASRRQRPTPLTGSRTLAMIGGPRKAGPPSESVARSSPTAQERSDMERDRRNTADNARVPDLTGALDEVTVFRLVHRATEGGLTGRLRLENDGVVKDLYFEDGRPVAIDSSEPADQLLAVLQRAGEISSDAADDLKERASEADATIEDYIVTSGLMAPHTLFHFLREQLSEKLLGALFWEKGAWAWWDEETVERDPFPLALDATDLLSRGVTEHADPKYLRRFFKSRKDVELKYIVQMEDLASTKLSPKAMRLYSNVKPGSNADSIIRLFADRYSWSQADVYRTLYWLTERDIIGFDGVEIPEMPGG